MEPLEHNASNKTNNSKTLGNESNDPQCKPNFNRKSLPQLSLGNLPLIGSFKPALNRKKKGNLLNAWNSTKSQLADQNNKVTKQSSINTSELINPNVNHNCVEEVKSHTQVHVSSTYLSVWRGK